MRRRGAVVTAEEARKVIERSRLGQGVRRIQRDTGISSGAIYKILKDLVPRLQIRGQTVTTRTDRRHVARYATLDVAAISKVEAAESWAWAEIESRGLLVPLHWGGEPYTPEESTAPRIPIQPQYPAPRLDVAFALPPPERLGVITGLASSGQVSSIILNENGYSERDTLRDGTGDGKGCWLAQPVALYNPDQRSASYLPPGSYEVKVTVGCSSGEGDERYYTLVSPASWEDLDLKPC